MKGEGVIGVIAATAAAIALAACGDLKTGEQCQDECAPGERSCSGDGVRTCSASPEGAGCAAWSGVERCPAETPFCSNGTCGDQCADECGAGDQRCEGSQLAGCGQGDSDECLDWLPGTECATPPASECVDANTLRVYEASGSCADDACTYPHSDTSCPDCPNCDACAGVVCDQPPAQCYRAQGTCADGTCTYDPDDGAPCDDGDACTNSDHCDGVICGGAPRVCSDPPPSTCIDANTLRTYSSPGNCADGTCTYQASDHFCPIGCGGGQCNGCPTDTIQCGDLCVDVRIDPNNCGRCGLVCPQGALCSMAQCQCVGGLELCNDSCVDTNTDPNNCGDCGVRCDARAGLTCLAGECQCPPGLELCQGRCVNTRTDSQHCGACGVVCNAGCRNGDCPEATFRECLPKPAPFRSCNEYCATIDKACLNTCPGDDGGAYKRYFDEQCTQVNGSFGRCDESISGSSSIQGFRCCCG